MGLEHKMAERLLQIKAIKLNVQNPFTWSSGLRSPIYCDNRIALSYPEMRKSVILALTRRATDFKPFDAIAGVATAGIPWGACLADKMDLPFVYVRSQAKSHGMKNQIEGQLADSSSVLVIEDLISTGASSLEAIAALRAEKHRVAGLLSIFQYGFPETSQKMAENLIKMASLTHFSVLLEQALQQGYIDSDEYEKLKNWNADPKAWSEQHSM